jgi:hypothetical protein
MKDNLSREITLLNERRSKLTTDVKSLENEYTEKRNLYGQLTKACQVEIDTLKVNHKTQIDNAVVTFEKEKENLRVMLRTKLDEYVLEYNSVLQQQNDEHIQRMEKLKTEKANYQELEKRLLMSCEELEKEMNQKGYFVTVQIPQNFSEYDAILPRLKLSFSDECQLVYPLSTMNYVFLYYFLDKSVISLLKAGDTLEINETKSDFYESWKFFKSTFKDIKIKKESKKENMFDIRGIIRK